MAQGDLGAVLDTLEFDTAQGQFVDIIPIAGDIYAVSYSGSGNDGWIATFTISSAGAISSAVTDTFEFDSVGVIGLRSKLIHISGEIYAVAWFGGNSIKIATFTVDSSGNIGAATIDTFESADTGAGIDIGSVLHISGDVYAVAYEDNDNDGKVFTVEITTAGAIGAAEIDTLEFDTSQGLLPSLIHISGTMYAVAYTGVDNDGWIATFTISNAGDIAAAVTATSEFDTGNCRAPKIIHVSSDYFAICYRGVDNHGFVVTLTIDSAGAISSVVSTLEFDTNYATDPVILDAVGAFTVAYTDADNDGIIKSFAISSVGIASSIIDTLEFDIADAYTISSILVGSGGVIAVAYNGVDNDGFVKTISITAGSIYPINPLLRVSGIKRTFFAGIGGQSVYQTELVLGGMSTTYISPIGEREPTSAIKPSPLPVGAGYSEADYYKWLSSFPSYQPIMIIFGGHIPSYLEWVRWKQLGSK